MFTSMPKAKFTEGAITEFMVTTVGDPSITLNITQGMPPAGVMLTNLGGGVGKLIGMPGPGTGGMTPTGNQYTFTINANDPAGLTLASQPFTLTVVPPTPASYPANVYNNNPGNVNPVAFWQLNEPIGSVTAKDLVGQPPVGTNPNGNHPGTYVNTSTQTNVSLPSQGATQPYLTLQQPSLLASPSTTDFSIQVQGGCVQVPFAAALNPPTFTLEALASPEATALTQKGFFYSVLSSLGPLARTGFAVYAAPIRGPLQPNSDYHWALAVGTGAGYAHLLPLGFTVNSLGVLTYTGILMNGTVSSDPLAIVTQLASTTGLGGLTVNGTGIPQGTTVMAILGATSVVLSGPCTAANVALTFWDPNHGTVMTGTISSGALTTVTGLASTTGLTPGMTVSGMGIAHRSGHHHSHRHQRAPLGLAQRPGHGPRQHRADFLGGPWSYSDAGNYLSRLHLRRKWNNGLLSLHRLCKQEHGLHHIPAGPSPSFAQLCLEPNKRSLHRQGSRNNARAFVPVLGEPRRGCDLQRCAFKADCDQSRPARHNGLAIMG
jgi:hypothetical protein